MISQQLATDAADLDAAASIESVEWILDKLLLQETEVDAKLQHLLDPNTQPDLTSLTTLQHTLNIDEQISQLIERIRPTAQTANSLSERVKKLDIEQARLKESLKYVEDVQELKSCVLGAHGAMERQDWDEAATFLHQASLLDTSIINGPLASATVPTSEIPDPPTVFLSQASDALFKLFLREFDAAAKVKDEERITRFFRLFPLIGKENEGLDVYGRFVCSIVAGRNRAAMTQSNTSSMFFATTLTALFESIARIVETHTTIVDRFYGTGKMVRVIQRLQGECDRQGGIILDSLWDERHIQRKVAETKAYSFNFLVQSFLPNPPSSNLRSATDGNRYRTGSPAPAVNGTDETIDAKAIDILLNEIAVVLARWNLYIKFLAVKCQYDAPKIEIPKFVLTAPLADKFTRLRGSFESLETFFFRRSVEKAFQLDELLSHQSGPPTTSVVDDVMFVLRKVLDRAMGTGDAELLKAICANTKRILDLDFAGVIKRRATVDSQRNLSGTSGKTDDLGRRERVRGLAVELNNLEVSSGSVSALAEGYIDSNLEGLFPFGDQMEVAKTALTNMGNLRERWADRQEGLAAMFVQSVKPGIKRLVNEIFAGVQYILNQQEYDELAVDEVVTRRFTIGWDGLILPFKDDLTPNNFQSLLNLSVKYLVDPLEKKLWSFRVNELGAIRLEKDISKITTHATRLGPYNLRERFAWCQQICIALNFDTEGISGGVEGAAAKILEEEGSEGWRLDKEDLIRLLEEVKVNG